MRLFLLFIGGLSISATYSQAPRPSYGPPTNEYGPRAGAATTYLSPSYSINSATAFVGPEVYSAPANEVIQDRSTTSALGPREFRQYDFHTHQVTDHYQARQLEVEMHKYRPSFFQPISNAPPVFAGRHSYAPVPDFAIQSSCNVFSPTGCIH